MKFLAFSQSAERVGPSRVRTARFEERSLLPVSAACVVANAVRESLGQLYDEPLAIRLFEPAVPSNRGWQAIARNALLFGVRGARCDAAIVLRPDDAAVLASLAFGETTGEARSLSRIEQAVLERAAVAVAAACAPVCGSISGQPALEPLSELAGFVTYVELWLERPVRAHIGIALSRDPRPETPAGSLQIEDLLDVAIELSVQTGPATLSAAELAELEPAAVVPMTSSRAVRGSLVLAGTVIASGECGVRDGRYAFVIGHPKISEGSLETTV